MKWIYFKEKESLSTLVQGEIKEKKAILCKEASNFKKRWWNQNKAIEYVFTTLRAAHGVFQSNIMKTIEFWTYTLCINTLIEAIENEELCSSIDIKLNKSEAG